jgi:hypothetical protein
MNKLKRLGFSVLIVSAFAVAGVINADTTSISTDANGITTQSHSSLNGTAKVEHIDYNSGAIQDSLRFKQTGVATTTPPEEATGGNNGGASVNTTSNANTGFSISRFEIETPRATNPARVSTDADFQAYARSVLNSDELVSNISSANGEVSVSYFQPTKLMGIINALVLVQVTVDAEGNVSITYPVWYNLFGKADEAAKFRNDLLHAVDVIGFDSGATTIGAGTQASIVSSLVEVMRNQIKTSVFATTTEAIVR